MLPHHYVHLKSVILHDHVAYEETLYFTIGVY